MLRQIRHNFSLNFLARLLGAGAKTVSNELTQPLM